MTKLKSFDEFHNLSEAKGDYEVSAIEKYLREKAPLYSEWSEHVDLEDAIKSKLDELLSKHMEHAKVVVEPEDTGDQLLDDCSDQISVITVTTKNELILKHSVLERIYSIELTPGHPFLYVCTEHMNSIWIFPEPTAFLETLWRFKV